MKIIITAGEISNKGLWEEACELLDINVWALNEGTIDSDEELVLSEDQARQLGLLPKEDDV